MSNALKRKKNKNKMQPLGYTEEELDRISRYSKTTSRIQNTAYKAYLDVELVSYLVLHDKFGFGKKRITRLKNVVDTYLEQSVTEEDVSMQTLMRVLKKNAGIDIRQEVKRIPYRECVVFDGEKNHHPYTGRIVSEAIYSYFVLSCVALKVIFKFSSKKLMEYLDYMRDMVNTLSRRKQFGLTVKDIAEVLMVECKYCDERYVRE